MWRWLCLTWTVFAAAGCATGPLQDNPLQLHTEMPLVTDNPLYVPLGPYAEDYALVFDKILDVIHDYYDIAYANRYDGRVETWPSVAPGLGQPWKPGSPDLYQRTLASFQSIRHRAIVRITVANDRGFFVDVKVLKELEDVPTPIRSTVSGAFRAMATVERQFDVVEEGQYENNWIPIGRDCKLEQVILSRIAQFEVAALRRAAANGAATDCPPARQP